MELNIDGNGCNIYLSDLFIGAGDMVVNIFDMGDIRSNTLKISGLSSNNGFDDYFLYTKVIQMMQLSCIMAEKALIIQ